MDNTIKFSFLTVALVAGAYLVYSQLGSSEFEYGDSSSSITYPNPDPMLSREEGRIEQAPRAEIGIGSLSNTEQQVSILEKSTSSAEPPYVEYNSANRPSSLFDAENYIDILEEIGVDSVTSDNLVSELRASREIILDRFRTRRERGEEYDQRFIAEQAEYTPAKIVLRYLTEEQLTKFYNVESARIGDFADFLKNITN